MSDNLYAERDVLALREHYCRHVDAMTREGLHDKSDIAAELAWRDSEIERLTQLVERAGEPVAEDGWYGEIAAPQDALYEQAAAMDNQDVPLEDWPDKLIGALARAGYAVVPVSLPHATLGEAAIAGVFETGNPKHGWDYLLSKVRAYPTRRTRSEP